ncbi:MAG: hypothetical protein R3B49_04445 [Phycisphaerales bacterium]
MLIGALLAFVLPCVVMITAKATRVGPTATERHVFMISGGGLEWRMSQEKLRTSVPLFALGIPTGQTHLEFHLESTNGAFDPAEVAAMKSALESQGVPVDIQVGEHAFGVHVGARLGDADEKLSAIPQATAPAPIPAPPATAAAAPSWSAVEWHWRWRLSRPRLWFVDWHQNQHSVVGLPTWPILLVPAACYAIPAAHRLRRLRRGLCPRCAYPLDKTGLCSECGRTYSASGSGL